MKHLGTKYLETPRLILRRFTLEDAQAMYDNWACDDEVTKFLTWPTHSSVAVSRKVLEDWVSSYARPDFYQWAIVLKDQGPDPIGSIAVVSQDDRARKAHIGYCIGRPWWHRGVMSEALKAVMDFLFDQVGMDRIESRHDPRNPHSGGVMRKCGMRYEGTLRQSDWNNQGICDASWYALLREQRKQEAGKLCLRPVDSRNIWELVKLSVREDQRNFVATNTESLLEAYTAVTSGGTALPYGIYDGDTPVGYLMIGYGGWEGAPKIAEGNYSLWRFMIDQRYQGRGYGKAALELALQEIRAFPCGRAEYCFLSYEPENVAARDLYHGFGFSENGERDEGEIVAVLKL